MDSCARLNNQGASQLVSGMYGDAVESFTGSLRIVKNALAVLAAERQRQRENGMNIDRPSSPSIETAKPEQHNKRSAILMLPQEQVVAVASTSAGGKHIGCTAAATQHRGLYVSPLLLSEGATYERYEVTVEASVGIMFNLALAHHLNAVYGPSCGSSHGTSTLDQAISLYELAYTVQMQEDAELSVEFTMAIINNLGHIHRLMGDEEKAAKCFGHLLSTILFLQSYGGGGQTANTSCQTDTFLYTISHLILRDAAAAAA